MKTQNTNLVVENLAIAQMKAYTKGRKKVNWYNFVPCHFHDESGIKCTNQKYRYLSNI